MIHSNIISWEEREESQKRSFGLLQVVPLLRLHQLAPLAQVALRHHQFLLLVHLALDRQRFHLAGYLLFGELRTD